MSNRLIVRLAVVAVAGIVTGCSNRGSCVCTAVDNPSDVITVDNEGGCGTVQSTFTDPVRSCFPASGSIAGPSTPLALRYRGGDGPAPELSMLPPAAGPSVATAYLMR
ncbi:MAG: hypothetical protein JNJ80_09795 [Gemmatimonadetes bacterium]|nr:hypothetical protein [Gemmatimonadota bacterium]MCC7132086.1 hypothetical protein [Gemmatimonadales bacterium]